MSAALLGDDHAATVPRGRRFGLMKAFVLATKSQQANKVNFIIVLRSRFLLYVVLLVGNQGLSFFGAFLAQLSFPFFFVVPMMWSVVGGRTCCVMWGCVGSIF
jgi:hypothetical protein